MNRSRIMGMELTKQRLSLTEINELMKYLSLSYKGIAGIHGEEHAQYKHHFGYAHGGTVKSNCGVISIRVYKDIDHYTYMGNVLNALLLDQYFNGWEAHKQKINELL